MPLRFLLRDACKGPYSDTIKTFDFVLRIDGDICYWNRSGFGYVYVRPAMGYATADIFVPREVWEPRDGRQIRAYLATNLRGAMVVILDRMEKKKIAVDRTRLLANVDSALQGFLTSS